MFARYYLDGIIAFEAVVNIVFSTLISTGAQASSKVNRLVDVLVKGWSWCDAADSLRGVSGGGKGGFWVFYTRGREAIEVNIT